MKAVDGTAYVTRKPYTVAAMRHGGTHLITPIVRSLTGRTVYSPKGLQSLNCIPSPVVIVFRRDPRNRLVSNFRYKNPGALERLNPTERDVQLAAFMVARSVKKPISPLEFMKRWALCWHQYPGAYCLSFENLIGPVGLLHVERLRDWLAAQGTETFKATPIEAYEYSLGKSGTWTGRHSRWEEWFGPLSREAWGKFHGDELVRYLGYRP